MNENYTNLPSCCISFCSNASFQNVSWGIAGIVCGIKSQFAPFVNRYEILWKTYNSKRFSAFQNFFRIENPLNIKKVMGRNMESSLFCTQCIDCFDMRAIECSLFCIQCFDCFDIPWNLVYFVHNVSTASTCMLLNVVFILHTMYRLLRRAYH